MMTLAVVPTDPVLVDLIASLNAIGSGGGFRQTERALGMVTTAIARAWQNEVGPTHRIERRKVTPFTHEVFSRDKVVGWIERGLAPFDMRTTHPKGKKSRVVKPRMRGGRLITQWTARRKDGSVYTVHAGDPYLIIPFRHRTRNAPGKGGKKTLTDAYAEVKKQTAGEEFRRAQIIAPPAEGAVSPNYWGEAVKRAKYDWGTRLKFPETEEYANLQGMVVMGPPKQSQFMTFRVVSVNSPAGAWQHPGIKARRHLYNIMTAGQEKIQNVIQEAVMKDMGQ